MDDKLLHLEKELFPDDAEYFMQMKNWEEFQEPKMVYLGVVDKEDYAYYKEHPDKTNERRLRNPEKLIEELRAKGYRAVSIDSLEAADPSTLVVSPTGIRTPYLSPKTIRKEVSELLDKLITSAVVYPMSYPHPRGLREEADMLDYEHDYKTEFSGYKHPHPERVKMIMETYGENFRTEMIEEAYRRRQSDQYLRDLSKKPGKKLAEVLFSVDMHCAKCVEKITGNIAFEKGVKDLKVSLDRRTVWIKYDASRTSEEALKSAIEKLGYKAEKI